MVQFPALGLRARCDGGATRARPAVNLWGATISSMAERAAAVDVTIRDLSSVEDMRAMAALLERIWQEPRILTIELLRALATHGNPVLGAFEGGRLVGAQMAFLGLEDGRTILHSHVTGIEPEGQHRGIGFLLKVAQRDWALAHAVDTVTWTFDPMIARNAYFNLRKLGAIGSRFLRDFYGPMDDAFNAGERSDRVEARWELRHPRVDTALGGGGPEPDAVGAAVLLDEEDGAPRPHLDRDGDRVLVRVPSDYLALREEDRDLATVWRDAVADTLEEAFARGFRATSFLRPGGYLMERE
jgi:predicted GNAT superfamily acetyltransferase